MPFFFACSSVLLSFSLCALDRELTDALKESADDVVGERESCVPFESNPLSASSSANENLLLTQSSSKCCAQHSNDSWESKD